MPGDGGASGEVPVLVVGGQLLGDVRLDDVDPLGELDLAGPGGSGSEITFRLKKGN